MAPKVCMTKLKKEMKVYMPADGILLLLIKHCIRLCSFPGVLEQSTATHTRNLCQRAKHAW